MSFSRKVVIFICELRRSVYTYNRQTEHRTCYFGSATSFGTLSHLTRFNNMLSKGNTPVISRGCLYALKCLRVSPVGFQTSEGSVAANSTSVELNKPFGFVCTELTLSTVWLFLFHSKIIPYRK